MKKLYFVLIELIMLLILVCACSAEQKTEETLLLLLWMRLMTCSPTAFRYSILIAIYWPLFLSPNISSEPYGFDDDDGVALKPGAQFILYSPDATGHGPGTELYGAMEFQSWMHKHKEFINADFSNFT